MSRPNFEIMDGLQGCKLYCVLHSFIFICREVSAGWSLSDKGSVILMPLSLFARLKEPQFLFPCLCCLPIDQWWCRRQMWRWHLDGRPWQNCRLLQGFLPHQQRYLQFLLLASYILKQPMIETSNLDHGSWFAMSVGNTILKKLTSLLQNILTGSIPGCLNAHAQYVLTQLKLCI